MFDENDGATLANLEKVNERNVYSCTGVPQSINLLQPYEARLYGCYFTYNDIYCCKHVNVLKGPFPHFNCYSMKLLTCHWH